MPKLYEYFGLIFLFYSNARLLLAYTGRPHFLFGYLKFNNYFWR